MTDLKGSEGPRITLMYRKFLQYGPYFTQGSIPTYSHFSPLFTQFPPYGGLGRIFRLKWEFIPDLNLTIKRYK